MYTTTAKQPTVVGERAFSMSEKVLTFPSAVTSMTVTPDHVWLVMSDGGVQIRDVSTTELVHCFASASRPRRVVRIWSILAVPDPAVGLQVWMGLSNGAVEVYDAQTFGVLRQQTKHAGGVYCLAEFGGYVYSGSSDFKIGQWYAADARLVRMLHGHSNYVRCLYAEGNAVVSGSDDCTVRVWDVGSGDAQLTGRFHDRSAVSALCRVGITMWSGDDSGRVVVWRLDTCEALHILQAHSGRVSSLKKVGSRVYSGGADGVIAVFDAEEGRLLSHVNNHNGARIGCLHCVWECSRYNVWAAVGEKLVQCWHQDEYRPSTQEQERVNDMRWYYSTVQSHHENNRRLLRQQAELSDLLTLASGGDAAVQKMLAASEEMKQSSIVKCWLLQQKIHEAEKKVQELRGLNSSMEVDILSRKRNLEAIKGFLQQTLDAVQNIRTHALRSRTTVPVNTTNTV
ncbi:WD domain [Trypanosoma brucei equiperdum]|uniref:WD domain n=1 Tax=Trypanosoma brucei equiperdum TaxID=630700 RepID=A0A3L6KW70_9TRYP|nr:WD domain [Trypanosoma brucei equiperdum]